MVYTVSQKTGCWTLVHNFPNVNQFSKLFYWQTQKIGKHLAKLWAKWLIVSYAPFDLDFCPQRCRTRQISKITCVWRTETLTDCCYVNKQTNLSLLSTISNCCRPVFLIFDRHTYVISDWLTAGHVRHFVATCFFRFSSTVQSIMVFLYG